MPAPTSQQPPKLFHKLLTEARAGSRPAMGRLLEDHRRFLLRLANDELPHDCRAKMSPSDLAQDTMAEALEHFAQFHGNSPEEFRSWIKTILMTTATDFGRAFRTRQLRSITREQPLDSVLSSEAELLDDPSAPSPLDELIRLETARLLNSCIAALPAPYEQVIRLRHIDMLPHHEVGTILGISENAARQLDRRALIELGRRLNAKHVTGILTV